MAVTSRKGKSITVVPNAVRYGINLNSVIDKDGKLQIQCVIRLQRAQKTGEGADAVWVDDPARDSATMLAFAPNMTEWLTEKVTIGKVTPETAGKIAAALEGLDDALELLNTELNLL